MKSALRLFFALAAIVLAASSAYAQTYKYAGKIGQYDVTVTLSLTDKDCTWEPGCSETYEGSYTYTKAGNSMKLEGVVNTMFDIIPLEEYTPKGKHSGSWELEGSMGDKVLKGTFTNLSTGKKLPIVLRRK